MTRAFILALLLTVGRLAAETGTASWYGAEVAGRPMANGKPFDPGALTCASWAYPLGTRLRVTNTQTGASVVVLVSDRGPAKRLVAAGRVIDLSRAAFGRIGDRTAGLVPVRVEIAGPVLALGGDK